MSHIRLDRNILEWEWYSDEHTKSLFIHCLLKANYKDCNFKGQIIKRGSFVTSYATLERELSLTINEIRTAFKHLKSTGEITSKSQGKYSVVTVKNYDKYQSDNKVNDKELTSKSQAINKLLTTRERNKEYKEVNNKREYKRKLGEFSHVHLLQKDIDKLVEELGTDKFEAVIKKLDEYIEQTGKSYKNHLLVIRKWVIKAVEEDENRQAESNKKRYETGRGTSSNNQFNNFTQRKYDYDELEKELLEQ